MTPVRYRDLGTLGIERASTWVPVVGQRLTSALGLLLVRANQRVSNDALIEAMWPDGTSVPDRSVSTLESHLYRLRRVLEPEHRRNEPFTTVLNDTQGYQLIASVDQVDSLRFEQLAGDVRALLAGGQARRALSRCDEALGLWRGRPWTPHTDEPWAAPAAARLVELRADVEEQRVDVLLRLGDAATALSDLEVLLDNHPLRERLWGLKMLAAYRGGRTDQALETYGRVRRTLIEEIGVEPGPELQRLHAQILADDPALAGPSSPDAAPVRGSASSAKAPAGPESGSANSNRVEIQLPTRRSPLIGRHAELTELAALVPAHSLVMVVGAPGCGKTSLVVEVARQLVDKFPDGVWFVDLTVAVDGAQLIDVVTSTLGLAAPEAGTVVDGLVSFCRSRRMLLVLDNCEHLLDPVADLIDSLLGVDTELAVLGTSREPTGLDGEQVWDLLPLPAPELTADAARVGAEGTSVEDIEGRAASAVRLASVELMLARLRDAAPRLRIGPAETLLAAEVCAAVDGIPLAIELAAAQARSFTLAEIAERVRTDPAGLARIGRGGQSHHTSLRSAIDLSTANLDDAERRLHRAIAVVPGPFTVSLAASLGQIEDEVTRTTLSQLVHRSMLSPLGPRRSGGPSRFAQLATIRAHGLGEQSPEEAAEHATRRDRWVRQLVDLLPRLGRPDGPAVYARIDEDLAAVRATLQAGLVDRPNTTGPYVAARLGQYWMHRGMITEWARWAELASTAAEADRSDQAQAALSGATALALSGRADVGIAHLVAVEAAMSSLSDPQVLPIADYLLGLVSLARDRRDLVATEQPVRVLRRLAAHTGDPAVGLLAEVAERLRQAMTAPSPEVLTALEHAYQQTMADRDPFASWLVATQATGVSIGIRDIDGGLRWSDRSMAHQENLGIGAKSSSLELRGILLALGGADAEAVRTFVRARAHARRIGHRWPSYSRSSDLLSAAEKRLSGDERERAYAQALELSSTG